MHLDPAKLARVRADTSRAIALVMGEAPASVVDVRRSKAVDSMRTHLEDIEGIARREPRGAFWRVREWLEQHCIDAPDDLFAKACALRDRLAVAL